MTLPVAPELFDVLLQCAKDAKKGKVKSGGETSAALTFCENFYAQFFQNRMRHQIERFDRAAKESAIRLRMEVKEKKGPKVIVLLILWYEKLCEILHGILALEYEEG